jgi:hypothetical protein
MGCAPGSHVGVVDITGMALLGCYAWGRGPCSSGLVDCRTRSTQFLDNWPSHWTEGQGGVGRMAKREKALGSE